MTPLRPSKNLVVVAALTLVYVIAGKLGLMLAFVHASATAVWPPTGIALAAFLLLGHRVWPAILLGAFVVNITTAGSVATSIGMATGKTLAGMVGAFLVRRFAHGPCAFDHGLDLFRCFVLSDVGPWRTLGGLGRCSRESQNASLLLLQILMGVTSVLALAFAALNSDRERTAPQHKLTEHALRDNETRARVLFQSASEGI